MINEKGEFSVEIHETSQKVCTAFYTLDILFKICCLIDIGKIELKTCMARKLSTPKPR